MDIKNEKETRSGFKIIADAIIYLADAIYQHNKIISHEGDEVEDPVQFDLSGKPF